MSKMEQLLKSAGFKLNSYPEGNFWELVIKDDETKKEKNCNNIWCCI